MEELKSKIKDWVSADNEIKKINNKLKDHRKQRTELGKEINTIIYEQNLQNREIQISDGKLKFQETKTVSPLTFSFIKECLSKYVTKEEKLNEIIEHIKSERVVKYNKDIKRTYSKK